jgi:hypothetical protein
VTTETPLNNSNSLSAEPIGTEEKNAALLIQLLDERAAKLDTDIVGKLAIARQQAVAAHMKAHPDAIQGSHGFFHLVANYLHDHRTLMSTAALGCAVLMAFLVTQQLVGGVSDQGDASLLASDLPPGAYADKGFDLWLAQNTHR